MLQLIYSSYRTFPALISGIDVEPSLRVQRDALPGLLNLRPIKISIDDSLFLFCLYHNLCIRVDH